MHNNPELTGRMADAIQKVQQFGYVVAFCQKSQKFQICEQDMWPVQEFAIDDWEGFIAYVDNFHDERK